MDKADRPDRRHPAEQHLFDLAKAEQTDRELESEEPATHTPTTPETPSYLLARQLAYAMVTAEIDGDPEVQGHVDQWHELERGERDDLDGHVIRSLRSIAADIALVAGESTGIGAENVIQITRLVDPQLDGPTAD